jgi:hypothetical protein
VHLLGNITWEQVSIMHGIENDFKFLNLVDVSNNKDVEWSAHNGNIYLVIVFAMNQSEMNIPDNEDDEPTIHLTELNKRFIKETNKMCRQIQNKYGMDVCRLIVVPDGRLTPYPLSLVGERWNEEGLSKYTYIRIFLFDEYFAFQSCTFTLHRL